MNIDYFFIKSLKKLFKKSHETKSHETIIIDAKKKVEDEFISKIKCTYSTNDSSLYIFVYDDMFNFERVSNIKGLTVFENVNGPTFFITHKNNRAIQL